jgi:hypothetical protein
MYHHFYTCMYRETVLVTENDGQQALEQRSNATAMEGYVGMESEAVAPSTLPATIMLPARTAGSPHNLLVSTAVSASHVAFSAVRLEPTWMMLGSAAGMIATLAIQRGAEISLQQREENRRTTNDFFNSGLVDLENVTAYFFNPDWQSGFPIHWSLCVEQVRTVDLQRRIIAQGQPIVYFSDMLVGEAGWMDLQLIAPHAFGATDGFAARPQDSLSRAMVVRLAYRHMLNIEILAVSRQNTLRLLAGMVRCNGLEPLCKRQIALWACQLVQALCCQSQQLPKNGLTTILAILGSRRLLH